MNAAGGVSVVKANVVSRSCFDAAGDGDLASGPAMAAQLARKEACYGNSTIA